MDLIKDPEILSKYSRDASLFEMRPKALATPKNVEEIKQLVHYAKENKESITVRAGGSDMTGGPLTESIIMDVKNLNKITRLGDSHVTVEPGVLSDGSK